MADKGAGPYGITAGPDGALWLTFAHSDQIARLTIQGELKEYPLDSPTCRPTVITSGPDGHCGSPGSRITRSAASPSTAEQKPSACRRPEADPSASPPAQATCCGSRLGRITSKGEITEFTLPVEGAFPSIITTGPDGALWFTLNQTNAIGRITVDGDVALYPLPTPGAAPVGITSDGDAMWFVEIAAGQLGRISTDGEIEEFPLPDLTAKPHAIVAASVGDCWFTEWGANRIGRITTTGEITEYDLPSPSSEPHGITTGPDAALWVALETVGVAPVAR